MRRTPPGPYPVPGARARRRRGHRSLSRSSCYPVRQGIFPAQGIFRSPPHLASNAESCATCTVSATTTGTLSNTASITPPSGYTNQGDHPSTDVDVLLTLGACGAPDDRTLTDLEVIFDWVIEACSSISVENTEVLNSLKLAAESVALGNGFSVSGELEVHNTLLKDSERARLQSQIRSFELSVSETGDIQ